MSSRTLALAGALSASALLGGLVVQRSPARLGALLGFPGVVLAPFTAPRGDNDGLWVLIVPFTVLVAALLIVRGVSDLV